ncbi:MAG TPA: methyltransferase [Paludibaculum sp.]|jgi:2-polyprenyl-3-methyl-5-hydroxy-6-metoxy-1,4-benzoquinol methylase
MLTPIKFMECLNGFQKSAVARAGVELQVFTHIARGRQTVDQIAAATQAAPRGIRILLDGLTVLDLIVKDGERYRLTRESAVFLDCESPEYLGGIIGFQHSPLMYAAFARFTEAVRQGGAVVSEEDTMQPDHAVWLDFARAMIPMALPQARFTAQIAGPVEKVLDVAAGHGMFGISILQACPEARCVAVDWARVLALAEENARIAAVEERWQALPGSVFDVELGDGYDAVLLPNLLHHFDKAGCVTMLRRLHSAMAANARLFIVEMIPHEDRVSPSAAAWFAMMMLATTAGGDAYTLAEYGAILREADFEAEQPTPVPGSARSVLVAARVSR